MKDSRNTSKTSFKVCGITSAGDFLSCWQLAVDYVGLNFVKGSKRHLSLENAQQVVRGADQGAGGIASAKPAMVAVLAQPELSFISDLLGALPDIGIIQLHGDETVDQAAAIAKQIGGRKVWQAVRVVEPGDIQRAAQYRDVVDLVLFDGKLPGSGLSFPWAWLKDCNIGVGFGIAGGVNANNIAASKAYNPDVVDVSSGVESAPGVKDYQKIVDILRLLRGN